MQEDSTANCINPFKTAKNTWFKPFQAPFGKAKIDSSRCDPSSKRSTSSATSAWAAPSFKPETKPQPVVQVETKQSGLPCSATELKSCNQTEMETSRVHFTSQTKETAMQEPFPKPPAPNSARETPKTVHLIQQWKQSDLPNKNSTIAKLVRRNAETDACPINEDSRRPI